MDSFFGQSLVQTVIHTENTTLTTNCGHNTPVVISDVYDLNKVPGVDLKCENLLQCGGLQAGHVGEKLKQEHLCSTDYLVSEPPFLRQNYISVMTV
jgi:hypothetical protein